MTCRDEDQQKHRFCATFAVLLTFLSLGCFQGTSAQAAVSRTSRAGAILVDAPWSQRRSGAKPAAGWKLSSTPGSLPSLGTVPQQLGVSSFPSISSDGFSRMQAVADRPVIGTEGTVTPKLAPWM